MGVHTHIYTYRQYRYIHIYILYTHIYILLKSINIVVKDFAHNFLCLFNLSMFAFIHSKYIFFKVTAVL